MSDDVFRTYLRAEAYNRLVKPRKPKKVDFGGMVVPISIVVPIMERVTENIKKPIEGRLSKYCQHCGAKMDEKEDNGDE